MDIDVTTGAASRVVGFEVMGQAADSLRVVEHAVGLGGRVLMAPVRIADSTIAVVSDPEGHPVGLCSAT